MPSIQLTFSATTAVPSGLVPLANTSTPQSMQDWCRIACLLNRYSFRLSPPARNTKLFGARKEKCRPFLVQIEQLQAVTMARSVVHSKRTRPQWQPPVKVLMSGIAQLHETVRPWQMTEFIARVRTRRGKFADFARDCVSAVSPRLSPASSDAQQKSPARCGAFSLRLQHRQAMMLTRVPWPGGSAACGGGGAVR